MITLGGCKPSASGAHALDRMGTEARIEIGSLQRDRSTAVRRAADGWELEEVWRIGGLNQPADETFGHVTAVSVSRAGLIAVLDFQAQDVKIISGDGRHVRTVGAPGQGPGEFDGPLALTWNARGDLWVVDGWNRRYTVFDSSGALHRTRPREILPASFRQTLTLTRDGDFIDETARRDGDRDALIFVRVDSSGSVLATYPPLFHPPMPAGNRPMAVPATLRPYLPRLVYAVSGDGFVWFARSDSLRIIKRSLEGDTVHIVHSSRRNFTLTRRDRRLISRTVQRMGRDFPNFQFSRQVVQGINILDDGHLILRIETEAGKAARELDVFSPTGQFLATIRTPLDFDPGVPPVFRGDTMIAVIRGAFDVQYLLRAHIRR